MSSPPRSASFSSSDEPSDHDHKFSSAGPNGEALDINGAAAASSADGKPKPYSDQAHLRNGRVKAGEQQKHKRPTHFICFPLVTDSSVPQLAESLKRFRDVTTAPAATRGTKGKGRDEGRETPDRDIEVSTAAGVTEGGQAVNYSRSQGGEAAGDGHDTEELKVIPASAHRPPGTFHLTIGTMDLSEKTEMQRAWRLLKSIDYASLLRSVEADADVNANGASGRSKGVALAGGVAKSKEKEVAMDATRPEHQEAARRPPFMDADDKTKLNPKSEDSYRETVSRVDRYVDQATPASPAQRSQRGPDPYRDTVSTVDRYMDHAAQSARRTQKDRTPPPGARTRTGTVPREKEGNIHGISGYKETVSTVDRYIDHAYDAAREAKGKVKGVVKKPLESLKRDVSPPPPSVSSRQRLLSVDSSTTNTDAESLLTVTSTSTIRPPAPALAQVQEQEPEKSSPLTVDLRGLGAFQSARKARVFYAPPVDPSGRLLAFANEIRQRFKEEGLVKEERELTLHATVANMTYASKGGHGGRKRWSKRPEMVDGRRVVEVFSGGERGVVVEAGVSGLEAGGTKGEIRGGHVWAKGVQIDHVRICKMGAEKSEDEVLGMVYPAVEVDGEKAEVAFA